MARRKQWDDACADPVAKAARTRLYDIVLKDATSTGHSVRNREGLTFNIPKEDCVTIGEVDPGATTEFTKPEMEDFMDRAHGYLFVKFVKDNGDIRSMYAHVNGRAIGGHMRLVDLEQNATETRSCRMERVFYVVCNGKKYVLKEAAFTKLMLETEKKNAPKPKKNATKPKAATKPGPGAAGKAKRASKKK